MILAMSYARKPSRNGAQKMNEELKKIKGLIVLKLTQIIDYLNKSANSDDPIEFHKTKRKNEQYKTKGKKLKRWGVE